MRVLSSLKLRPPGKFVMITASQEEMSTPSSPAPSTSPSLADSMPNSLLSAFTFTSSVGIVKKAAETRALKRELFRSQHQLRLMKIDLERERADWLRERHEFEAKIKQLEENLQETNHDVAFISEAEEKAKQDLEKFRSKSSATERELRSEIITLKQKLAVEQDARIDAEERAAKLFSQHEMNSHLVDPSEEFESFVEQWTARVHELQESEAALSARLAQVEQENEQLKSQQGSKENYEVLNRLLLSTFSSLDDAKEELQRRRAEVERISARIGSVLELEEKLRSATVELARLRSDQSRPSTPAPQQITQQIQVPASAVETLKVASLTAEVAQLRDQLLLSQEQVSVLTAELESKAAAQKTQEDLLKDARKRIFELEARLKRQ